MAAAKTIWDQVYESRDPSGFIENHTFTEAELDTRYPRPGKMEGETLLTGILWEMVGYSAQDDELGDSESFGWYGKFDGVELKGIGRKIYAIVHTGSTGFVSRTDYPSHEALEKDWKKLESEYEEFDRDHENFVDDRPLKEARP